MTRRAHACAMDADRFVLTDVPDAGCDACLSDLRPRRCIGCVACLEKHPGHCAIADGFTPVMDEILRHRVLVMRVSPVRGKVPDAVRKAVERLSNVLDAYTDCGGNEPLPTDAVGLRSVVVEYRGDFEDRMESEIARALKKGPVSDISFIQL